MCPALPMRILLPMSAWTLVSALTVLFAVALARGRPDGQRLPPGYDGDRQLAELRVRRPLPRSAGDDSAVPSAGPGECRHPGSSVSG